MFCLLIPGFTREKFQLLFNPENLKSIKLDVDFLAKFFVQVETVSCDPRGKKRNVSGSYNREMVGRS